MLAGSPKTLQIHSPKLVQGQEGKVPNRVLAGRGVSWVGVRAAGQGLPAPIAPRPARRLSRRAVPAVSQLPRGPPAPLPGGSWTRELCQGGTLHRLNWQQVVVTWVPSTVLVMGWQLSVHHAEWVVRRPDSGEGSGNRC